MHRARPVSWCLLHRLRAPLFLVLLLTALPHDAWAKRRRVSFFPKDLDMEKPGAVEMDTRVGAIHNADGTALVLPDIETDFGVAPRLELGLDVQGGLDPRTLAWAWSDQVWLSAKHLLLDQHSATAAYAVGLQHGIRFAAVPGTWAFGYQAVGLWSVTHEHWQLVASGGAYIDPPEIETGHRPGGLLAGVDMSIDLVGDWDLAPSLGFALHREGTVDAVLACDLELDLGVWGSVRTGGLGGWQDSQRVVGWEVGYAPRFRWKR